MGCNCLFGRTTNMYVRLKQRNIKCEYEIRSFILYWRLACYALSNASDVSINAAEQYLFAFRTLLILSTSLYLSNSCNSIASCMSGNLNWWSLIVWVCLYQSSRWLSKGARAVRCCLFWLFTRYHQDLSCFPVRWEGILSCIFRLLIYNTSLIVLAVVSRWLNQNHQLLGYWFHWWCLSLLVLMEIHLKRIIEIFFNLDLHISTDFFFFPLFFRVIYS